MGSFAVEGVSLIISHLAVSRDESIAGAGGGRCAFRQVCVCVCVCVRSLIASSVCVWFPSECAQKLIALGRRRAPNLPGRSPSNSRNRRKRTDRICCTNGRARWSQSISGRFGTGRRRSAPARRPVAPLSLRSSTSSPCACWPSSPRGARRPPPGWAWTRRRASSAPTCRLRAPGAAAAVAGALAARAAPSFACREMAKRSY